MSKQNNKLNLNYSLEFNTRTFYVFFCPGAHWLCKLLKRGFGHCFCIEQLEYVYILSDLTRFGLNIFIPECPVEHPLIDNMLNLDESMTVLKITTKVNKESSIAKPKPLTCVSVLEQVIGVTFGLFESLTPHRFYKSLLKCKHPNLIEVSKYGRQGSRESS